MNSLSEQFKELSNQIFNGQFKEVLSQIKKRLDKDDLKLEEELYLRALRSQIFFYQGKFEEAINVADKILEEADEKKHQFTIIRALFQKASTLQFLEKFNESIEVSDKGLKILSSMKKYDEKEFASSKALMQFMKSSNQFYVGLMKECVKNAKEAVINIEKSNNEFYKTILKSWDAFLLYAFGKVSEAEQKMVKVIKKTEELNKRLLTCFINLHYGTVLIQVDIKKAKRLLKQAIEISEEIGANFPLGVFYSHLAIAYSTEKDYDKAVELYEKALEHKFGVGVIHFNLGWIYLVKDEIETAYEHYKLALEESKDKEELRVRPHLYYNLVFISTLLNNKEQAKKYLKELEKFSKQNDYETIKHSLTRAKILLLKESNDMKDWLKAIELIEDFIALEDVRMERKIDPYFHLIELRLKELQLTAKKELLQEVKEHIKTVQDYAEQTKGYYTLANIYRLKSQLALVELEPEKASEFLITAKTIAQEKNLKFVVNNIIDDQTKLEEQKNMWNQLKEQNISLKETLNKVHIDNSVKKLASESVIEIRDEKTGDVINYRKLYAIKI